MTPTQRTLHACLAISAAVVLASGCSSNAVRPDTAAATTPDPTPVTSETSSAEPTPACFNPWGGSCLGPLEAGTYRTTVFDPAIRYRVPDGWVNAEDLPGNFLLYREDDPQDGFEGGSYIGIYTDIRAPRGCEEAWAEGVGHTPAELAQWYVDHPGLAASQPREIEVGGLPGLLLDGPLREDWKGRCPWSEGRPVVPVIIGGGVSDLHHVSLHPLAVRLLLLEWNGTNVTIEITSHRKQHSPQEYLELVKPVLRSLRFSNDT